MRLNLVVLLSSALLAAASPEPLAASMKILESRQAIPRLQVFCHFMIGIESDRTSSADYDTDMVRAKSYGIDAFALNIGGPRLTELPILIVHFAYESAARNGMKVFISYDFNWWNTGQGSQIGSHLAQYAALPAQLFVNGAAFVSSFAGDGVDVAAMRSAAGRSIMFVPNFHPGQGNFGIIDGALNWMGWPSDGNNKAPRGGASVSVAAGDAAYAAALGGKPYLAPASPWFSTHYGPEVSYSKNWVFPGDLLWYNRWNELLQLRASFIEIVTWNDYGESHYVGPLSSKHQDDGGSKWVNDMPHNAWLDMAKPFIAAYKAGATSTNSFITEDQIIYWYRPTLAALNCDATDTTANTPANNASGNYFEGRPDGWQSMQDAVFVVTLLKTAGVLTVTSGGHTQTFNAPAGAAAFTVPMFVGQQSFALARNNANVLAANSLRDVSNVCPCGLYNFNAYTGSVPAGFVDQMGPDGLASLVAGLHVATCHPSPSLPTSAPPYTGPGGTVTAPPTTTTTTTSPPITSPPTTTTTMTTTTTSRPGGGSCTITASEQIRPTNCLQKGCVWNGPPGTATPDTCDG
ncbi:glycosyl hydrolase family 71-domain-containing protein [Mycena belliarum]|uniref:Glycosyl hydrolase family 71-domain-containing protein n=1 Tax=Mycena belliarum TaxID=1033014 RepID=A0AAD6XE13_9AGAR|nr:glycosyl hydrolase family 71-domain-containing protein [Mycena belliae]